MASTVLITGASQGIGRAIATQFARHDFNVVLAARHRDALDRAAAELQAAHHTAMAIPTDVRDANQVNTLVQKTLDQFGSLDVLVNNAGIYISGPVRQFTLEDWHQAIDTNLWGYIHTIQAVLPHFEARRAGTIVNIGSISGKVPMPYLVPYTTSKFAITGLTQSLRAELKHKGIHVCGIYPNLIKSNFLERAIFRGNDAEDVQERQQQVHTVMQMPLIEKPEKVAVAVWDAVNHQREEVAVGSAKLPASLYRVFPSGLRWLIGKVFRNHD